MINIPVFTNDELVNFAKIYTRENGYTIDQMAMLSLYNLISTSQKEDQPMNIGIAPIIAGVITAAVVGFLAIKLLRWMVTTNKLHIFAIYTLILGVTVVVLGIIEHSTGINAITGAALHF